MKARSQVTSSAALTERVAVAISLGCLLQAYIHFFEAKANLFIGLLFYALIPYGPAGALLAWVCARFINRRPNAAGLE